MRTRKLRGGVRTETKKTVSQKRRRLLKRASKRRARSLKPIFKYNPKVWTNPVLSKQNLKGMRIFNLDPIEENSNSNNNSNNNSNSPRTTANGFLKMIIRELKVILENSHDDKYTLYAMHIRDNTKRLLEEKFVRLDDKNPDDPFDYIEELIEYIKKNIKDSENFKSPKLLTISTYDLANVVSKAMEQSKNELERQHSNSELVALFGKAKI